MINFCSTSATVFPSSSSLLSAVSLPISFFIIGDGAVAATAADASGDTGDCISLLPPKRFSPVSRIAVSSISSPVARSTARCIVFSSSRTLPLQ